MTGLYNLQSDIDTAVKGLEEDNYFQAYRLAEKNLTAYLC
jgi:hypothetical protein